MSTIGLTSIADVVVLSEIIVGIVLSTISKIETKWKMATRQTDRYMAYASRVVLSEAVD